MAKSEYEKWSENIKAFLKKGATQEQWEFATQLNKALRMLDWDEQYFRTISSILNNKYRPQTLKKTIEKAKLLIKNRFDQINQIAKGVHK